MFYILLIGCVACLIYFGLIRPFTYWKRKGIPQYSVSRIWWNRILEFIQQTPHTEVMVRLHKDFYNERYVGTYDLFTPKLCIKDQELIKQICIKDFTSFIDHTRFIPVHGDPIMEKNLFFIKGVEWRRMRAIASPSFTGNKMRFMFVLMLECAEQFLEYFDKQNSDMIIVEMKDTFGRITSDFFASTHFGITCNSLKERNNEIYLMGKIGLDFSGVRMKLKCILIKIMPQIMTALGIKLFDQRVCAFFKSLVQKNMEYRRINNIIRPDLIHLLMNPGKRREKQEKPGSDSIDIAAQDNSPTSKDANMNPHLLSANDLTSIAMALFGGGYDTMSNLMSFAAYELATNQNVQQKLQTEIDFTLQKSQNPITYTNLLNMEYLDMVILETLRKWPTGTFFDRQCVKPYTIQPINSKERPVHLANENHVWVPLYALHRDQKYFPQPDLFLPERFGGENKRNIHIFPYMPFGLGPRNCIGSRFAIMEAKLLLFYILSRYTFEIVDKTVVPLRVARLDFQLNSKNGLWLGLKRRAKFHCTIGV